VLLREVAERGYRGGQTQLCTLLRMLKPMQAADPVVRFETAPGEQLQVYWAEFRKGANPLSQAGLLYFGEWHTHAEDHPDA
jgi:transposase